MSTEPRFHTEFGISLIHKLAAEGRTAGVQLFKDMKGRWFATSRRNPEQLHALTGYSCDCLQFMCHQSCPHHAMLLEELKWLEPETTPDPQPAVMCDQCGEPMAYISGCSFECTCGETYSPSWEVIDKIEMAVYATSAREGGGELIDELTAMLVADWNPYPAGADPDEFPCREDASALLNVGSYSANEIAACLIWQRDRQDVADRMAS